MIDAAAITDDDAVLLANEHPCDWVNPQPTGVYDLVVLGAGLGGLMAATLAADRGARVAIIEKHLIGGECFNTGCIPTQSILRSSRLYADMRNAAAFGGTEPVLPVSVDFPQVMARMRAIRARISGHISVGMLQRKGIDIYFGEGCFTGSNQISLDGVALKFKKAIIATGAHPQMPGIPGLAAATPWTNETIFTLEKLPDSLLVIGGGALGCELAQAFARLGSRVIIVQADPMFLDNVERDGAQILSDALAEDGVEIHLNTEVTGVTAAGFLKRVEIQSVGDVSTIDVSDILVATGQVPNTAGLGLDRAKIKMNDDGELIVDRHLRTSNPDIYAVGNICAGHQSTHIPDDMAYIATQNALFGTRLAPKPYAAPWCIYTDPEVAHVGVQVRQARERNIPVKTFTILMHQVDRAIADSEDTGFVKIHVREGTDRILGATVVSRNAGDIMNSISLALDMQIGLGQLAATPYPYPTNGNAIKMAGQAWLASKKTSLPERFRNLWR